MEAAALIENIAKMLDEMAVVDPVAHRDWHKRLESLHDSLENDLRVAIRWSKME